MKLRTATVTYEFKEGLPNYSNHTASITLVYERQYDDDEDQETIDRQLNFEQAMAENAVMRSVRRAHDQAVAAALANGAKGNGAANGHQPPPAVAVAPPASPQPSPPPASPQPQPQPPPNAANGNGNGYHAAPPVNRVYGRPTSPSQLAGWLNNEGSQHKDKVMQLCRKHGYKTYLKELTQEQAMWLLDQVDPQGPAY